MSSILTQRYRDVLTIEDLLWACDEVLPQLHEVVPAALVRFPGHLRGGTPPNDLNAVMQALKRKSETGPEFRGHQYAKMRRWMFFRVLDRRAKAGPSGRLQTSINAKALARLRRSARERGQTQGELLAEALDAYLTEL